LVCIGHLCIRGRAPRKTYAQQLSLLFIVMVLAYTLKYRRDINPPITPKIVNNNGLSGAQFGITESLTLYAIE